MDFDPQAAVDRSAGGGFRCPYQTSTTLDWQRRAAEAHFQEGDNLAAPPYLAPFPNAPEIAALIAADGPLIRLPDIEPDCVKTEPAVSLSSLVAHDLFSTP